MTADKRVYAGLSFVLLFSGFSIALLYDLIMAQGILGAFEAKELIFLVLGIFGLAIGHMVNRMYMVDDRRSAAERRSTLLTFGILLFVGMTAITMAMQNFFAYQTSLQEKSAVVVLSAAPFEEAFFRFLLASALFRAMIRILANVGRATNLPFVKDENSQRITAMVITAVIVAMVFVQFHNAVYTLTDPRVYSFLFVNAAAYTIAYLYTGDIMTSTTAHLLHNAAVLFL